LSDVSYLWTRFLVGHLSHIDKKNAVFLERDMISELFLESMQFLSGYLTAKHTVLNTITVIQKGFEHLIPAAIIRDIVTDKYKATSHGLPRCHSCISRDISPQPTGKQPRLDTNDGTPRASIIE
jgi:ribonucleotide reductase beta subunit family protein with ferritin-like domain